MLVRVVVFYFCGFLFFFLVMPRILFLLFSFCFTFFYIFLRFIHNILFRVHIFSVIIVPFYRVKGRTASL